MLVTRLNGSEREVLDAGPGQTIVTTLGEAFECPDKLAEKLVAEDPGKWTGPRAARADKRHSKREES